MIRVLFVMALLCVQGFCSELSKELVDSYLSALPKKQLIDPQNLLDPKQQEETASLLNYHNQDASIELRLCLLSKDQTLPAEFAGEMTEGPKPVALIYYYYGDPSRSECRHSGLVSKAISGIEQKRALESAIVQALVKKNDYEQLSAFLEQMSVRLYLMEQILDGHEKAFKTERKKKEIRKKSLIPEIPEQLLLVGIAGVVVIFIIVCLWGLHWWRATHAKYLFPDASAESRLGGNYAAGIGAVISFQSADLPPSSQREQSAEIVVRR